VTVDADRPGPEWTDGLHGDEVIEQLRRWGDSGALWRVVALDESRVVIALLTDVHRVEVGRITSTDRRVLAFVTDTPDTHPPTSAGPGRLLSG
jgi:hypothetical protein